MRGFWQGVNAPGPHPADGEVLQGHPDGYVDWGLEQAQANVGNPPAPGTLHVGLHPQPFIGNIEDPLIFILHGNPGFSFVDYDDEFGNEGHAAACLQNLQNADLGFFPLGTASAGTGAARYWHNAFRGAIHDLAEMRNITAEEAREIFRENVGLIESCAYHSKKTPGLWRDNLPSSGIAREYVQDVVFPRARLGESLVFVWRRVGNDDYWGRGDAHPNIMVRARRAAQNPNILANERGAIVGFLHERIH